jgi:hypothetical protein
MFEEENECKKSKYHLVLLPLSHTMSLSDLRDEVDRLQKEYMALDNLFRLRKDLPLVQELLNERFKALHNRISEVESKQ